MDRYPLGGDAQRYSRTVQEIGNFHRDWEFWSRTVTLGPLLIVVSMLIWATGMVGNAMFFLLATAAVTVTLILLFVFVSKTNRLTRLHMDAIALMPLNQDDQDDLDNL